MHGILLIDKPEGLTSTEVVRRVKRQWHTKTGHLGTLDPFASGLLPICVGEGTKIAPFLNAADKAYSGTIHLGARTDTGDPTGEVIETAPPPHEVGSADLARVAEAFLGEQEQVPPMYSAIKRAGRPLYELARQGITVERTARRVHIARLDLRVTSTNTVEFLVDCSKGTYVRVLAEAIAVELGTVGHLTRLRRLRFGRFHIDDSASLDKLEDLPTAALLSARAALADMAEYVLRQEDVARVRQGSTPLLTRLDLPSDADVVKLVTPAGELSAVVTREPAGAWRYARVFAAD